MGYPEFMDTIIARPNTTQWTLLAVMPERRKEVLTLVARMAVKDPLLLLDGGNQANIHAIAQQAGWQEKMTDHIRVARAFTCHQMANLLDSVEDGPEIIFILDLLSTFYDENISLSERFRLLKICLQCIGRFVQTRMLLVTVTPPPPKAEGSVQLFDYLLTIAPKLHVVKGYPRAEQQPRLF
jgi:hypothetical protein